MKKRAHKRTKAGHVKKSRAKINSAVAPRKPDQSVVTCDEKPSDTPKNTTIPCDVASLHVLVATGKGAAVVADFTASARRIYEPPPEDCPQRIVSDLTHYDFVIEVVSVDTAVTFEGAQDYFNTAEATINGSWHGKCPLHSHALIHMHPLESQDSSFENEWHATSSPKTKLPARKPGFFSREFGWGQFPKGEPMPIEVNALSCGVRFDKAPIHQLKSLLRIYPRDDWAIKLKLPAFSERKFSKSAKGEITSGNLVSTESRSKSTFGAPDSKSGYSTTRNPNMEVTKHSAYQGRSDASGTYTQMTMKKDTEGDKSVFTNERVTTTGNGVYGTTATKTTYNTSSGPDKDEEESGVRLSLTVSRNGAQLDVAKVVTSIIHLIEKGRSVFGCFSDMLKVVPKVGYTLDLSLVLLEGTIGYQCGYRVSPTARSDRYTAVTSYVDVTGSLKVVEASIELGIGFDVTVPCVVDWFATKNIFEVVLKLAGKITAACMLDCNVQFQDKRQEEVKLSPSLGFKVNLVFNATLLGKGLRTEVGIRSRGFLVAGRALFTAVGPPALSLDFGLDGGEAYGYYFHDGIIWDSSDHFELPLWTSQSFYHGQFPKPVAA